jgi:hypothetical protein
MVAATRSSVNTFLRRFASKISSLSWLIPMRGRSSNSNATGGKAFMIKIKTSNIKILVQIVGL